MKIALIGATGYVGAKLLPEALARGHQVTAIVRKGTLPEHPSLTHTLGDATVPAVLAKLVSGHDLVISAYNPSHDADGTATHAIIDGVKSSGVRRFLVVGGAGSLRLPSGERVVDQPDFPAQWKEGALRTAAFLEQLRAEIELDWVFLSPAAMLVPGARTGRYRIGKDDLLTDATGQSTISLEDYAVAMLDEAERPQHHRARFTVAY
ncbi:MAG: NAD(P)-dependent oxidoreductase [Burkholderiales bacterium]|nr:NAD(P)-dependent oxidoreductase [Burkholderiales bacterium]